ncbi:hypothetical protein PIB30_021798 [Stylosanthes scabra]|uniref:Uncharacterized protein n=1 Tax=Stylosanthes scabra TaxID=79078 RepID=A0ABU6WCJ0_9FABA|nr:hypothetical protein [Stylosanthes scabra]
MNELPYSDDKDAAEGASVVSLEEKVACGFSRSFWKEQSILGEGDLGPFKEGVAGGKLWEENHACETVENLVLDSLVVHFK